MVNRVQALRATVHLSQGCETDVAVVLSCPGRYEEAAGHPAAGNTGRNLERLLSLLGPRLGLTKLLRKQITITNAWDRVEYKRKTGRSEALDGEVTQAENINRLAHELRDVTMLIIFCGEKARLASDRLRQRSLLSRSVQMAFVAHLGGRGLNKSIKADLSNQPIVDAVAQRDNGRRHSLRQIQRENTDRRLEVVVEHLLASRVSTQ